MYGKKRQGSIPLVMLVVMVLAVGAGASLFLSQNTARMEKRFGLKTQATSLAQSAVEEVLVRLTNGSAAWDPTQAARFAYEPKATNAVVASLAEQGINATITPVQVMGRTAEEKTPDAAAEQAFKELMSVGPNFGFSSAATLIAPDGTAHANRFMNTRWVDQMIADNPAWLPLVREFVDNELTLSGEGNAYYTNNVKGYMARASDDGDFANATSLRVRQAFDDIPVLPVDAGWETRALTDYDASRAVAVEGTLTKFAEAMDEVGNQVANRIEGCAGDKAYGFGAMIADFALGGGADNNSAEEEDFVENGRDSGKLEYKTALVTVGAEVKIEGGGVTTRENYLAHRLVATTDASEAASITRQQTLIYLMYAYNLSPQDIEYFQTSYPEKYGNMANFNTNTDGTVKSMTAMPGLWMGLYTRHNDLAGVTVVPFEAANCLVKTREV